MRANVYIVSAPSGSGKTTLLQSLLRTFKDLKFSVSHTDAAAPTGRAARGGLFLYGAAGLSARWSDRGEFLEWAEYYGQLYGTSLSFVEEQVERGPDVILDIDVNGARQVKEKIRDAICRVHHAAVV